MSKKRIMKKYFESSYLTFELTSNKNLKFVMERFEHIHYLEENDVYTFKNHETSDYYFQQRPIGGERPFPVMNLKILDKDLISILLSHDLVSKKVNDFVEDQNMDEYRSQIQNAICYYNSSYSIFFSLEYNIVKYIWFDYDDNLSIESDRLAILKLLSYLAEKYALILIDWYEKKIVDIKKKEIILQYLNNTAGNSA
jgi:hypothetical protein